MEFESAFAKLRRTSCETSLLAEMPAARQHFFLFSPDFLFLPVVSSPATLPANAGEGASFS
jgi:hypothetical protein